MITYEVNDFNDFSNEKYQQQINNLPIHKIQCSCGRTGTFIRYGTYSRIVHCPDKDVELSIQRLLCCNCNCNKTHALLPASIVPYSRHSLSDQVDVITCYNNKCSYEDVMNNNPQIDENIIRYLIKLYLRFWEQIILSFKISLFPLSNLTCKCFSSDYHRPFMQTHKGVNIYFSPPT